MRNISAICALTIFLAAGCSEPVRVVAAPPPPPPHLQVWQTQTLHNAGLPDATRIWVVQTGVDGHQRVVLCDEAFLGTPVDPRKLCVAWPP